MSFNEQTFLEAMPLETEAQGDLHGWALGLDVGANSIGWMLVRDVPVPRSINAVGGVRVFPAATATEKNIEKSKTAERRVARGMRRQHDRRSRRLRRLTYVLREIGLLPPKPQSIDFIYAWDPYELRARGLDEKLEPAELARALIHLAQRRGFQSNRKAAGEEKETKKIKESLEKLREEMDKAKCRTVGEYLHKCVPLLRDRRRGRYLHRRMIKDEFELLWQKQGEFYPNLLDEKIKQQVYDSIFYQRPFLKPERLARLVGHCEFEPEHKRARVGHRLVQRYRIAQEVANIRLIAPDGAERSLTQQEMAKVRDYLDSHDKIEFDAEKNKLSKFHKLLGLDANVSVNFLRARRTSLKGNEVEVKFRKALGSKWEEFTEEQRNALNELVLDELDDDRLVERAQAEFHLSADQAKSLTELALPDRLGRVSLEAIRKLLPHLESGKSLTEAIQAVGYDKRRELKRVYDLLPFPPGTRLAPKREKELVEQGLLLPNTTEITNPVVRKALFEVRKLVNAIIKKYGKPRRIVVELARDTSGSIEQRNEIAKEQRNREAENKKIAEELKTRGIPDPSRTDIIKYRLWKECNETCPYSGQAISFEQLFISGEVEIEHIIPFTRSLDDSFANKTLCFREWNQKKGDRTPYEAFAKSDPEAYEKILQRVRAFSSEFRTQKLRRFRQETVELDQCVARQLNDTRYIARQVREYLQLLGVPVNVTRGQVTAALRRHWGLNTILSPDGSDEKNRLDHRHHAVDAAVIAMTTAKHLKNLARREDFRREREPFPAPWAGFREAVQCAVEKIIVSFAPTRRVRGPLHEETNYGPTGGDGKYVYRKPVRELTLNEVRDKVRDPEIKRIIEERLDEKYPEWRQQKGTDRIPAHVIPENQPIVLRNRRGDPVPIKKVRLVTSLGNAIGLPRSQPYRYVKPGENHHLEIFEYEERGKHKMEAVAVTLFEAAQRLRNGQPVVSRQHPTRPDARFVMSLCKNDMVRVKEKEGPWRYLRVQKFSTVPALDLLLQPHTVVGANSDTALRINSFKPGFTMEKINVSVLGEITPAND
ncbi:MAG: type II CRISPR RNA-guided endonuclease Cas9 [Candidatus Sumerlaeaceae bacterium]|nr:type II CRISPR RNA-guided endonuclease Cas9 [Candidatus Sumerlaeaceae bacterium]